MEACENHIQYHQLPHYDQHCCLPIDIFYIKKTCLTKIFDLLGNDKLYQLRTPINQPVCLYPNENTHTEYLYNHSHDSLHHPIEHQEQWKPSMDSERDEQQHYHVADLLKHVMPSIKLKHIVLVFGIYLFVYQRGHIKVFKKEKDNYYEKWRRLQDTYTHTQAILYYNKMNKNINNSNNDRIINDQQNGSIWSFD
jgi:hypothetical protein